MSAESHQVRVLAEGWANYAMVPTGSPTFACARCGTMVAGFIAPPAGGVADGRDLHDKHCPGRTK